MEIMRFLSWLDFKLETANPWTKITVIEEKVRIISFMIAIMISITIYMDKNGIIYPTNLKELLFEAKTKHGT